MALTDILRQRTARKGGTAQVDCGELGLLTVEALSPADCAGLSDSRALLYAACRELQRAGETLRSEGSLFRPDEITAYLTDDETDAAARTILELSGMSGGELSLTGGRSGLSEVRPQSVQGSAEAISKIRPQSVQSDFSGKDSPAAEGEIRPSSVQAPKGNFETSGQDSHEFPGEQTIFAPSDRTDKKAQILGEMSSRPAQILVRDEDEFCQSVFAAAGEKPDLHEIESDLRNRGRGGLHETGSEFRAGGLRNLHEMTSDFGQGRGSLLHETESESAGGVHETKSEPAGMVHEIKSELQRGLHEIRSEVREMLHEIESELPEQAARRLAEALLRAGQVR